MRVKLLLVSALALACLFSCGPQKILTSAPYAPMLAYYANCTYVAENSSPVEIMQFALLLQGTVPSPSPSDERGRKVLAAMRATLDVILQPDPGMIGFPVTGALFEQYSYSITPVEVVAESVTSISVRVTRTSTRPLAGPAKPAAAAPDSLVQESPGPAFAVTEVDDWVKVQGQWRLKALHAYLVLG